MRARVCAAGLAAIVVLTPWVAIAQGPSAQKPAVALSKPLSQSLTGAAKSDFDAGKLLASDGDYAGALIKFQSAYDLSKDPRLLWNVAFCHKNLRHYAKVIATLRRYIEEGGASLPASDRKDAQDLIATIEPFTTKVTVHVNVDGAEVSVDDEPLGTSPLAAAAVLDIGERRLRVTKEGYRSIERPLVVGGSAEITTDVALEQEVREGKLVVEAPAGATILLDEKEVGTGRVEQTVAAGGHQVRVTAPGMHPYQTEIVVQDRETRHIQVALEAALPAERPKMRVAVGCADPEPRSPQDSLVVYDGLDVLPPGFVRGRLNAATGKNVVQYVEYPVASGPHRIRVAIADCKPLELAVDIDPLRGADVAGALPSDRAFPVRGPEGSPGWYRLGVAFWSPGWGSKIRSNVPENYVGGAFSASGVALEAGLVDRWVAAYVNAGFAQGSLQRDTHASHYALPEQASTSYKRLSLRVGPRFPLSAVALGLGAHVGVEEVDLQGVRTGHPSLAGVVGGYFEVDVQPLCDWGILATLGVDKPTDDDDVSASLQLGAFFEPNPRCRRERATMPGLKSAAPEQVGLAAPQ
jgi:hypothetical protein